MVTKLIKFLNARYLRYVCNTSTGGSAFYNVGVKAEATNRVVFDKARVAKSRFVLKGTGNEVAVHAEHVTNCQFIIKGKNNKVILEEGVGMYNGTIIIRGTNCTVRIGKRTTFGGVRIVNVGMDNAIEIGEGCLFSDGIEIWGSDTHSIYNESGVQINREKPVIIGNKVWVGSKAVILKGVSIGDGAVVGMASVVTKDVAQKSIAVGNPARIIKQDVSWDLKYPGE